jgi:tetratricopeptide (TPR) repeat protein
MSLSGEFNPGTAMILYNMGCTYIAIRDYDKALIYLEKCLIIRKNIFG